MSTKGKSHIFVALGIALILGTSLYVLGGRQFTSFLSLPGMSLDGASRMVSAGLAALPVTTDTTHVRAFWLDDLRDKFINYQGRLWPTGDKGGVLSHFRLLPFHAERMVFDHQGILYALDYNTVLAYDAGQDTLKKPVVSTDTAYSTLIAAPDGKIYAPGYVDKILIYDPRDGTREVVNAPVSERRIVWWSAQPDGLIYGYDHDQGKVIAYNPANNEIIPIDFQWPGWSLYPPDPVEGDDGLSYYTFEWYDGRSARAHYGVGGLDLVKRVVASREMPMSEITAIAPRPGGGVYLGADGGLWALQSLKPSVRGYVRRFLQDVWHWHLPELYELPLPAGIAPFRTIALTADGKGKLYGIGERKSYRFLFTFNPGKDAFEELEPLLSWSYPRQMLVGPDNRVYLADDPVMSFEPGTYALSRTVQSGRIEPTTLMLTRTAVGNVSASVQDLACGHDGRIYGVVSNASKDDWLFWYDPRTPQAGASRAAPQVLPDYGGGYWSGGGTTLTVLDDDRIVGGTYWGDLYVYTPATGKTWDVGQPVSDTDRIVDLELGRDGWVYGGTLSYHNSATLFAFNPDTGAIVNLGTPFSPTYLMDAVTVGQDGRVYLAGNCALAAYNPSTGQMARLNWDKDKQGCPHALAASQNGQIYIGSGVHLYAYDPSDGSTSDLGRAPGNIVGLTIARNEQIYASIRDEYNSGRSSYVTYQSAVYDPATKQMTGLGLDVWRGPIKFAACGDGMIYGGSNTTDSNYISAAYLFAFRADCPDNPVGTWDSVTWEADTPRGTRVTVDVLDRNGKVLLGNVRNGGSLRAIDPVANTAIILQATLSTADPHVTPALKRWRVDYAFQCKKQWSSAIGGWEDDG